MTLFNLLVGLGFSTPVVLALLYVLLYPTQAEKVGSILWKCLYRIGIGVSYAHKKYTQHAIQSSVNSFIESKFSGIPGLDSEGVKVEWVGADTDRAAFLKEGKVVVRMRQSDPHDENIARAIFFFVSAGLLFQAKKYLSKSQAEATDLYVTHRILIGQPQSVVAHFMDNHLHPGLDAGAKRTRGMFKAFEAIDSGGLFFPVYLREVANIGRKVFGKPKSEDIKSDVSGMVDFLQDFALRRVGDEKVHLTRRGLYAKVAFVIAGRRWKIKSSVSPYVKYISKLKASGIETVYLLGDIENIQEINDICSEVNGEWHLAQRLKVKCLLYKDDGSVPHRRYMAVLEVKKPDDQLVEPPPDRLGHGVVAGI